MIVYKITNVFYGSSYVGQTVESFSERWRRHISKAASGSRAYLHRAIRKYGPDAFASEILHECESKEEMDFVETFYISLLNTKAPNGYNLTDGGEGATGFKHSEEMKKRISEFRVGKDNHQKGRKRSEESIKRMIEAQKKNSLTNPGNTGHKHSEESKKKMSESKKGHTAWNKGMKMPFKTRKKRALQ